jgi:hypothetical protein
VTWAGLAVVAAASAVLSFATVRDLAASAGYPAELAWLLPVVIDATAVVGSRIWLAGVGDPGAIGYARALALAAAVVTVGANVLQHGLAAYHQRPEWWLVAALAAVPPTALVAVAHQVALLARPLPAPTPATEPDTDPADDGHPVDPADGWPADGQPVGDELAHRARRVVSAAERPIGRRRLARELAISEHQARQLLAHLDERPSEHSGSGEAETNEDETNEASGRNGELRHV